MNKYIKDGKVAVLYSPGYGGGWSTWCRNEENRRKMIFCPEIAKILDDYENDDNVDKTEVFLRIQEVAEELFPREFLGCIDSCQLSIEWLDEGTVFEIDEYDGYESVGILYNRNCLVA